jgi:hypothetical protein
MTEGCQPELVEGGYCIGFHNLTAQQVIERKIFSIHFLWISYLRYFANLINLVL